MCFSSHSMSHLFLYLFLTITVELERKLPERTNEAQACDQSPLGEEESHQGEQSKIDTRSLGHDNNDGGVEEEPEVSEWTFSPLRSKGEMKKEKAAVSGWGIPTSEEADVLPDEVFASEETSWAPEHFTEDTDCKWPRHEAWNFGTTKDVTAEPHTAAEEAIPAEEPCFAAPEGASYIDEPYNIVPEEESMPEDTLPVLEAVSNEDSQADAIIKDFDEFHPPPLPPSSTVTSVLEVAAPAAPSSTVTSILEAAAPGAPTEDSHTITLKILNGSKILRSVVFIRACTRTAILNEAKAYCVKCAQNDQRLGTLLAKEHDLAFISLKMYGYEMDLSTYKVENLSSLVRAVEKTSIPRFTLRISEL